MSISASANISDIQRFVKRLGEASEAIQNYQSESGFDQLLQALQKEVNRLNETVNKNNELKNKADQKKQKCEDKINKTNESISKTKAKIADVQQKISDAASSPLTAALVVPLTAELAVLEAKLAADQAELGRLKAVLNQIKSMIEGIDKRVEKINQSIEKMQKANEKIEKIKSEIDEKLNDLEVKLNSGSSTLENAISALQDYTDSDITEYEGSGEKYEFQEKFIWTDEIKKAGLTEGERSQLGSETGYSDKILKFARTDKEAQLYKSFNLLESSIDGRPCLKQPHIEMEQTVRYMWRGQICYANNLERMQRGEAPILSNGEIVELHHIGQEPNSPFAELSTSQHRSALTNKILHTSIYERSKIDRNAFAFKERKPYWRARAAEYLREREKMGNE